MNKEEKRQQLVNDCHRGRMGKIMLKLQEQVAREHQNYQDQVAHENARRENVVITKHREHS